jgi:Zn-dependent protease
MPSAPTDLVQRCRTCTEALPPGALACPRCHSLTHEEDLERLANDAKTLEASSQFRAARDKWEQALGLLPRDAQQAEWIRQRSKMLLNRALDAEAPKKDNKWAKRLGPLGPVAVLLAKAKTLFVFLFKFKFLLSFAAFLTVYWALFGAKFGIGFAVMILIHEMGHFIDVKRRGLPADMPVFLPGLGAFVRWQALGVSVETRSAISLAGPLAGWIASAVCVAIWWKTGGPIWAALARVGAWLNVLNLIPVWVFDGGSAAYALGRIERLLLLAASLALGLILHEPVFYFLAAGALYRLFTHDLPAHPSKMITAYYLTLLVCLGGILHFIPGQGLNTQ